VTVGLEMLDDLVLEIKAGMVAADMDFHRPILSQRKTPPDFSDGVSPSRKEQAGTTCVAVLV